VEKPVNFTAGVGACGFGGAADATADTVGIGVVAAVVALVVGAPVGDST